VTDVTKHLPSIIPWHATIEDQTLEIDLPNPLSPAGNLPDIRGRYDPGNVVFSAPQGLASRHVALLNAHGFTAWLAAFRDPLVPGGATWIAWDIEVEASETPIHSSAVGPLIYQTFGSPLFVHRLVADTLIAGATDCVVAPDPFGHLDYYESLLKMFGLRAPWCVDIKYRRLTILPGKPDDLALLSWNVRGNMFALRAFPHLRPLAAYNASDVMHVQENEPLFAWESGSLLSGGHDQEGRSVCLHCTFAVGESFRTRTTGWKSNALDLPAQNTTVIEPISNPAHFDVFLCHNSTDKPEVKKIGRILMERGLQPWLDEWDLRPGFPWQTALEDQIRNIGAAAVFVGSSCVGPWQHQELAAFIREFVRRGCPVIPVILQSCRGSPQLPVFLSGMTWVDFRESQPDPVERLIWGVTGSNPNLNR
jgi:hypothetical protein